MVLLPDGYNRSPYASLSIGFQPAQPAILRPVIGLTVSLVGRDPHDYYDGSDSLGLSPLSRARVPYKK